MATAFHQVTNNAAGVLDAAISDIDTSFDLGTGEGAEFDAALQWLTIGRSGDYPGEILEVSSRSSDAFTVSARGEQGTTATSHEAGDAVECLLTAEHISEIQDAINAIENGTVTLAQVKLGDDTGKLIFGAGSDFYWAYDGTLDFLGLYEGVGDKPMVIINSLVSGNGAPFTFAVGDDWDAWEADNSGLNYPDDLNNWHFYSSNDTVAVMEIESRGETVLSLECNSDGAGTAAAYILYQKGQTNYWSAGLKASDSNAYVIGTGANLGTPVLHLNHSSYLATFSGSIDAKDFYNDDATPTLSTYFSATVGGVMVAPNKNIATFTAAGNTSARVQLNDIGGTTNQRIAEIVCDSPSLKFDRRTDAGLATTMLTLDLNTTNATFGAALAAKQGGATDTINIGGTVYVSTTAVGNVGTGEDDLMSHSVTAGTLGTNNGSLHFEMHFKTAANANNKTIKVKYGSTTLWDSGAVAANDQRVKVRGRIYRTGAATQIAVVEVLASGGYTSTVVTTSPTETLANAITLKATGEATDNDDVQQLAMIVEWHPANT